MDKIRHVEFHWKPVFAALGQGESTSIHHVIQGTWINFYPEVTRHRLRHKEFFKRFYRIRKHSPISRTTKYSVSRFFSHTCNVEKFPSYRASCKTPNPEDFYWPESSRNAFFVQVVSFAGTSDCLIFWRPCLWTAGLLLEIYSSSNGQKRVYADLRCLISMISKKVLGLQADEWYLA